MNVLKISPKVPPPISIGKLARATGFTVDRLRIWELRYGAPRGERLPSGHRRYPLGEVERLHLVREALARGARPRDTVALDREGLLRLLEAEGPAAAATPRAGSARLPWVAQAWVQAAVRMDDAALERQFMEQWLTLGSLVFLRDRVAPFIQALGEEWHRGRLTAAEEHFGSEKMGDFLAGIWRRLNDMNRGAPVLLTTLPGDPHRIGLQMAALVSALAGLKVLYLGPSTPLREVAAAAAKQGLRAVMLSVSLSSDRDDARRAVQALRLELPAGVKLVVGGAHAPHPNGEDWLRFEDLQDFYAWARAWVGAPLAAA